MIGLSGAASFCVDPRELISLSKRMRGSLCREQAVCVDVNKDIFSVEVLDERDGICTIEKDSITAIIAGSVYGDKAIGSKKSSKAEFLYQTYITKGIDACTALNGCYAFLLYDMRNRAIYIGMDQNSIIPVYYLETKGILYFSWDIESLLRVIPGGTSLNAQNLMSWLLVGGRGFMDQTRFEGVRRLEPGSWVRFSKSGIKMTRGVPFHFKPDGSSEDKLLDEAAEAIVQATRRRMLHGTKALLGLSGGIDSRILLAAAVKAAGPDLICYTYGKPNFNERDIARRVAQYYGLHHVDICYDDLLYLQYAHDGVFYSGGASLFKHGVQHHMFATLRSRYNTQGLLMGSALDLVLGATHSPSQVYSLKDRRELLDFYGNAKQMGDIKNFLRFNIAKDIFLDLCHDKNKALAFWDQSANILKECIRRIPGDHPADINDALAFDIRIRRWYNHNLIYPLHSHRLLLPTYDSDFMDVISRVPWQLRKDSQFRIKLLLRLDRGLADIPYNSTMQPAWLLPPHTYGFEKIQQDIDKARQMVWFSSGKKIYLASNRFDANFLEWFRIYPDYQKFLFDVLTGKESVLCDLFFKREKLRLLVDSHINGERNYQKLLQMLVSAELMCRIFLRGDRRIHREFADLSTCFLDKSSEEFSSKRGINARR